MVRHINSREINEARAVDDRVVVEVKKNTQDFLCGSRLVHVRARQIHVERKRVELAGAKPIQLNPCGAVDERN